MSPSAPAYKLFLVPSASHAIKGESVLIQAGIPCSLIPVPRTVSSRCGVCLRVELDLGDRAAEVLARAGVQISGAHDLWDQQTEKGTTR